jgi:hypothetical protein
MTMTAVRWLRLRRRLCRSSRCKMLPICGATSSCGAARRRCCKRRPSRLSSTWVSVAGSGDVQLKRLLDSRRADARRRQRGRRDGAVAVLQRIPSMTYASLAEENARNEQSVLSRLYNARVDFLQESRTPVSIRWWGATVDLTHDDVQRIFAGTAWLGSISSLLGRLLAGEPNAVLALGDHAVCGLSTALRWRTSIVVVAFASACHGSLSRHCPIHLLVLANATV